MVFVFFFMYYAEGNVLVFVNESGEANEGVDCVVMVLNEGWMNGQVGGPQDKEEVFFYKQNRRLVTYNKHRV